MGLGLLGLLLSGTIAFGATTKPCPSAENYEETFKFLSRDEADLPAALKMKYAEIVSQGCENSARRFKQVYIVLKNSGVAIQRTLEVAAEFSSQTNEQAKNFSETFQKIFLKKYYDFDFQTAYNISLELSRDVKAGADVLRNDFLKLVDFCLDEKGMTLPLRTCAETSLKTVKLNLNSTESIFPDWKNCYSFLREDSRLGMNQLDSLKNLEEILQGGPGSCANFKKTFEFATKSSGLGLDPNSALKLSKKVALQTKSNDAP